MLKSLTIASVTIAAAFAFGLSAGSANAYVRFTDGSAADAVGRCHEATKGVTYRVDNLGNRPLWFRIIALNLDDGTRTPGPWSRIDPRNSMANVIQLGTLIEPSHRYRLYLHYARYLGGRWQYRVDWIRGIGVCVL
jgi:hypothetical protein